MITDTIMCHDDGDDDDDDDDDGDDDDDDDNVCGYNGVLNHEDGDVSRKPPITLNAIASTHNPFSDKYPDDNHHIMIMMIVITMIMTITFNAIASTKNPFSDKYPVIIIS